MNVQFWLAWDICDGAFRLWLMISCVLSWDSVRSCLPELCPDVLQQIFILLGCGRGMRRQLRVVTSWINKTWIIQNSKNWTSTFCCPVWFTYQCSEENLCEPDVFYLSLHLKNWEQPAWWTSTLLFSSQVGLITDNQELKLFLPSSLCGLLLNRMVAVLPCARRFWGLLWG